MAIDRWDPFRDMLTLRDAMDRLFEQSFVRPSSLSTMPATGAFPMDVEDEGDHYVVRASLPGVKPEDMHVSVRGNTLTIRAETREERGDQEPQSGQGTPKNQGSEGQSQRRPSWIMRERRFGVFQRTITLPTEVNADAAQATCQNGELVLTLPKSEQAKPRQIQVSSQGRLPEAATGAANRQRAAGERSS